MRPDLPTTPGSKWAVRRAKELGGDPAWHIGQKWFAVRNGVLEEVRQEDLLERTATSTHGVAPAATVERTPSLDDHPMWRRDPRN